MTDEQREREEQDLCLACGCPSADSEFCPDCEDK